MQTPRASRDLGVLPLAVLKDKPAFELEPEPELELELEALESAELPETAAEPPDDAEEPAAEGKDPEIL